MRRELELSETIHNTSLDIKDRGTAIRERGRGVESQRERECVCEREKERER